MRKSAAAFAGIAVGLVILGVSTLLAGGMLRVGWSTGTPAPVIAVGGAFIDHTPLWLKELAINTFGTKDKLALLSGIGVVLTIGCALLGRLALRRGTPALLGFVVFGAIGTAAVLSRAHASPQDALPTVVGTLAGLWALNRLVHAQRAAGPNDQRVAVLERRSVLGWASALSVVGAGATLVGQRFGGQSAKVITSRADLRVPSVRGPVLVPRAAQVQVPGVSPYITPNTAFYRIDTALIVPQLAASDWRLRVRGMVEREVSIDWNTLISKPMQQAMITLCCVSNEVGGELISNAIWTGWPIRELLAMAGPSAGADMVLSTSSDGFTAGTPLSALTDSRNALLAVGMNGEPLPLEHGFPVRMVVPGLYGYVSATKWLVDLKVTTFADDMGYWTPRGWSANGPIKTESRIDVPRSGARVKAGTVAVAGVAWAQHRGIEGVEVRIDRGPWRTARLADEPTIDAWRQWTLPWQATSGSHTISVRATDVHHVVQTASVAPPAPNGASGYHTIQVTVG